MKRILFFTILFFPLLAFSQTRQDSVGVKTISSLTELTANIDTSYEVIFHDPSTGKISYRASVGEFLKTINALPSVIGTSQIINATIINEDISGSAAIALSKLQNLTANRLVGRDTTGTGIPESLTVGYGFQMGTDRIDIDTVSASGLVSKSRLTNALDDVVASGGGIWEQENSTTLATVNTTDNYHEGEIGIGDFSSNLIAAPIHVYATDARIRLSDSTSTDTTVIAYLEYYRGYNSTLIGRVGYLDNTDTDITVENNLTGGDIDFETEGTTKLKILASGQLQLPEYGDTTFTGTAVKYLAVTDDGTVIEADGGGGGGNWSVSGSNLYYNSGNVGIGTSSPGGLLELQDAGLVTLKVNSTGGGTPGYINNSAGGLLTIVSNNFGAALIDATKNSSRILFDPTSGNIDFDVSATGSATLNTIMTIDTNKVYFNEAVVVNDTSQFRGDINIREATTNPGFYLRRENVTYGAFANMGLALNISTNLFSGSQEDATKPSWILSLDPNNNYTKIQSRAAGGGSNDDELTIYRDSLVMTGDIKTSGGAFIDDGTTIVAPDYVFESDYNFMPIRDYINTIKGQKHLIGARSANQLKKEIPVTEEMFANREAIENNVLYIEVLLNKIEALEARISELEKAKK